MIIDAHATVIIPDMIPKLPPFFAKATEPELLKRMDEAKIKRSIIWSLPRTPAAVKANNDWVAGVVKQHPDRFTGFVCVYPLDTEAALSEIEHRLSTPEFAGLKLHPLVQGFPMNHPSALTIVRRAKEYDIPVVIHVTSAAMEPLTTDEAKKKQVELNREQPLSAPNLLLDIIELYDSPKVMAAHLGGIYDDQICASKISFQTTGASVEALEYAYQKVGAGRIVYGSDYPFFEPAAEVAKVKAAKIPQEAKDKILGQNVAALLRTKP
ncbi:MAG: amidohydrolase family protein [Chloroflexi bacterium]|nr:amidohydrolase family protein [Chloroflexota bacterium]MCL5075045.1 amidohydrolase family protein [Chloroflexota bacterium]